MIETGIAGAGLAIRHVSTNKTTVSPSLNMPSRDSNALETLLDSYHSQHTMLPVASRQCAEIAAQEGKALDAVLFTSASMSGGNSASQRGLNRPTRHSLLQQAVQASKSSEARVRGFLSTLARQQRFHCTMRASKKADMQILHTLCSNVIPFQKFELYTRMWHGRLYAKGNFGNQNSTHEQKALDGEPTYFEDGFTKARDPNAFDKDVLSPHPGTSAGRVRLSKPRAVIPMANDSSETDDEDSESTDAGRDDAKKRVTFVRVSESGSDVNKAWLTSDCATESEGEGTTLKRTQKRGRPRLTPDESGAHHRQRKRRKSVPRLVLGL